jgi:hypothetical protein
MTGGSWEVTAKLESSKYAVKARDDGGNDDTRYEAGTDLALGTAVNLVFNSEEQGIFFGVNTVYAQSGVNGQVSFFTDSTHITGDSNLFWDNSGKNLGIGTGSPGYKLDINGALRLRPSSAPTGANGVIYYDLGANAFKFYQNGAWVDLGSGGGTPAGSSGYVQFNNSGAFGGDAGLFWDNTNKRLGIGTTTPSTLLTIQGSSGEFVKLNSGSINSILKVNPSDANSAGAIWSANTRFKLERADLSASVSFSPASGNLFEIFNNTYVQGNLYTSGNVGIGTTSPEVSLHVIGLINAKSKADGTGPAGITFYDSNGIEVGSFGLPGTGVDVSGHREMFFRAGGVTGELNPDDNWFVQRFGAASNKHYFGDTGSVSWFQSGHSLYIKANIGSGPSTLVTPDMVISSGNVGIGTTNPGSLLHIYGSNPILRLDGSGGTSELNFYDSGVQKHRIRLTTDNRLQFSYGPSTDLVTITSGGNVGIGTTNPGEKLEVNGGVRLNTASAKPTCDSSKRGTLWFTQGAGGVKDALEVCAKDAGDAYAWRTIY